MYEKIRKFCEKKEISISAFERLCGVSNGYVLKLKSSKPSAKFAVRASQVMGISVEELMEL